MGYFVWYYRFGLPQYVRNSWQSLKKISHFFALSALITTLFYPWKRLSADTTTFNLERFFENLSYNFISRFIGFWVRLVLIFTCLFLLLLIFLIRLIGGLLGFIFPFFGFAAYYGYRVSESSKLTNLYSQLTQNPAEFYQILFTSPAGKFILAHLPVDPALYSLLQSFKFTPDGSPSDFQSLLALWLSQTSKAESSLAKLGLKPDDLILAGRWWDLLSAPGEAAMSGLGRSGIGVDLTFGYSPILNHHSEDLSLAIPSSHQLIGRSEVVSRIRTVLESGRSCILTGEPGVGRMTVVFELVERALNGQLGKYFNFKRILRLDHQSLMVNSDLDAKRDAFKKVLLEAENAGNIILVIKDFQRLINPSVGGNDFSDILNDVLSRNRLPIIALCDLEDFQRYLSHDSRITKYFDRVDVTEPSPEQALDILFLAAAVKEHRTRVIFTVPALRQLITGSAKFISETPFPEKVLELLEELSVQKSSADNKIVTVDDANALLTAKTKIPLSRLTESEKSLLANIENVIHQDLIGQDAAISLIGKSLRARSVGLKNSDRPVGSFLFLGPTGVGKTETAKVLSKVYYGSADSILRFDMAEYAGANSIDRLIDALSTAVHDHPASLLLIDEIEKAPPEIFNLFLTLLDEGYISDASGKKIVCSHLFVIATSNAGAEFVRQQVAAKVSNADLQKSVLNYVQENHIFTAEFLNRFDGVVVFEPLTPENLISVTGLLMTKFAAGLKAKNIFLEYGPEVLKKLVEENYEPTLGARPIRRAVDLTLSDIFSKSILDNTLVGGDHVRLLPLAGKDEFKLEKTA